MTTRVQVNTYAYAVTYLSDQIIRSLKQIIVGVGLDPTKFVGDWPSTDKAISTWLGSKHLTKVILEIYDSSTDNLVSRWDFPVDYGYSTLDDGDFWVDTDAVRFAIVKAGHFPSACKYDLTLVVSPGRPDVPGWEKGSLRSTDGFVQQNLGTIAGANTLAASASYWRKS